MNQLDTETKRACRAVRRIYGETTKDWEEWEYLDSRFDGGEWSGPAWADKYEAELDRVTGVVAREFGILRHELEEAFFTYVGEESYRYVVALTKVAST